MFKVYRLFLVGFGIVVLLNGCAALSPAFEEPTLQVNSIKLKNSNSLAPEFEISLRVTNPNRDTLNIKGMSYTLNLAGNQVVSGVANDLPPSAAYGDTDVKIMATLSILGGFKLLNELMNEYQESIQYQLIARLDVGSFYPRITITREGVIKF
jgi:LEA14-like dessication related protein